MGLVAGGVLALVAIGVAAVLVLSDSGQEAPTEPARYEITINNGWPQTADEKRVGSYLESTWRNPVGPIITIDSRLSDETGSPLANAELAKVQTSQLPDYRERVFKKARLGGRPTVLWGFDTSKDESRMELFFEECDTAFIVRGSMTTVNFESYAESFRDMTSTLEADCDE